MDRRAFPALLLLAAKSCSSQTTTTTTTTAIACPLGHAAAVDTGKQLVLADASGDFTAMTSDNTLYVCAQCGLVFIR